MQSKLAERLHLRYEPAAILFSGEKPSDARTYPDGQWVCAAAMLSAAMRGRTFAVGHSTGVCHGGRHGLCLNDKRTARVDGHMTCGVPGVKAMPGREPLGLKKTVEFAAADRENTPYRNIPEEYVIFRPLSLVKENETPRMVVMYADCDQLSALTAMANFDRAGFDNVIVPSASACVTFCLLTEEENRREFPRAIISMTDLFARRFIDNDLLAFSIPWKLYQEMEENVRSMSGNFLDRPAWKHLEGRKSRFFPARENPAPSRNLLAGAEQ